MYFTVTDFFVYLNYSYMNDLLLEYITSIKIYISVAHIAEWLFTPVNSNKVRWEHLWTH